jgi:hypothetical protein
MGWHISRGFHSTHIEDACPCPQEPCGFVDSAKVEPECDQHPIGRAKTIRNSHKPENCPRSEEPSDDH